ncbi:MAG: hypothetical protein ACLFN5_07760 [bacterium]
MQNSGITIDIIGDSGPFSMLGKSIGYRIRVGAAEFLLDCGAPVFQLLGEEGLAELQGLIITHSHADHNRWFTDMALFNYFSARTSEKLNLFCSKQILTELQQSSHYALRQTLGPQRQQIVNIGFDDYFNAHILGSQPRYACKQMAIDNQITWRVVDDSGNILPPGKAKVFLRDDLQEPRMLFKDPVENIWVEPESFYSYTDDRFYKNTDDISHTHPCGLKITPVKATAWHGPHTNSYLFEYDNEKIFFSSDTHYNPRLWQQLTQRRQGSHNPPEDLFVLNDDINSYIEKTWSRQRLERALSFYNEQLMTIHDVTGPHGQVHTPYHFLEKRNSRIILTHSPDEFTTLHPLAHLKKTFFLNNNQIFEKTKSGQIFPIIGDCFHKVFSRFFIGFKNENGDWRLVKKSSGEYDVLSENVKNTDCQELYRVELYEDIGGEYFPALKKKNQRYILRPDGKVELQTHDTKQTNGKVVTGQRQQLTDRHPPR